MSGVKVRDFVVHILVGAGLLLMLSACQTSKHAEVMSTEDLPEQAQDLDQEQDEQAVAEDSFFGESEEFQDEPAVAEDSFFGEPEGFQDESAMLDETFEESEGLRESPAMTEDGFEESADFQDESAMDERISGATMDGFENGGFPVMPSDPMVDSDHIEEMDMGMMTDSKRDMQAGTAVGLSHVFFEYDSYEIRPDATDVLRSNARILNEQYQDASVLIEGHCDERGTVDYNLELGKRRAQAVKDSLIDLGVRESRIRIVSYGKERPFCTESEPGCWAQNRRGHFLVQQ